MPSGLSNALARSLLNHMFGATVYTPLANVFISLLTTNPTDWANGTGAVEAAGISRASVANNATNFPAAATASNATSKSNGAAIAFGNAPGALTLTGFGIYTASTGGTWMAGGALTANVAVTTGNAISFGIGALTLQINTGVTGGLTGLAARRLLDLAFGAVAYTPPVTLFGGYFTTAPAYGAGTGGVEPAAGGYARVAKTNNTSNFLNATGTTTATKTNGTAFAFANPTASQGTAVAGGVWDAATAGNLLWAGNLTTPRALGVGSTNVQFAASTMALNIDPT